MKQKKRISRRSFLKTGTGMAAAAPLAPAIIGLGVKNVLAAPSPLNQWPGRAVLNYNNLHNATPTGGTAADETVVKKMVDDAILLLTGQATVGEAWKAVFPGITPASKIAIKINILNAIIPSHPFVVMGITGGLLQMDVGGSAFPAANITLYDSNNTRSLTNAGFTAARFPGVNLVHYGKPSDQYSGLKI